MENAIKERKKLSERYKKLLDIEKKMDEDVLLDKRKADLYFEVENAYLTYQKKVVCSDLVKTLEPFLKEIYRLSQEIVSEMKECGASLEELDLALKREDAFKNLNERLKNMIKYNEDDLYEIGKSIKELDESLSKNNKDTQECVNVVRILANLSKIPDFQDEAKTFDVAQRVINNLKTKLEELNLKQQNKE